MEECSSNVKLGYFMLSEYGFAPQRCSPLSVGYDLRSAYSSVVPQNGKQLIKTDISIKLPDKCYGRIAPRSGLAVNNFITVGGGVIDKDYTGNVCVLLFNHSNTDFIVNRGDRIAQLICEKAYYPELYEMKCVDVTERNSKGFGSSGIN